MPCGCRLRLGGCVCVCCVAARCRRSCSPRRALIGRHCVVCARACVVLEWYGMCVEGAWGLRGTNMHQKVHPMPPTDMPTTEHCITSHHTTLRYTPHHSDSTTLTPYDRVSHRDTPHRSMPTMNTTPQCQTIALRFTTPHHMTPHLAPRALAKPVESRPVLKPLMWCVGSVYPDFAAIA